MRLAILLLSLTLCVAEEPKPLSAPRLSDAAKYRISAAQLAAQTALTDLLQTPQYAALQAANANAQKVVADAEKQAGCQIDLKVLGCLAR